MFVSKRGLAVGVFIGLVIGLVSGYAVALSGTIGLEQRISDLERQVTELQTEIENKNARMADLQTQISEKDNQISELQSQIEAKNSQIVALQDQLSELQSQLEENREYPVGYIESSVIGAAEYPITVYYPALDNGINAEPCRCHAPYPAIVFAHGLLMSKEAYAWLLNRTASRGYIAIGFTAPSSLLNPLENIEKEEDAMIRCIDYIVQKTGFLKDLVDASRVGVAGHSLGSMTALKVTADDDRVKACVSIAPFHQDWVASIMPDWIDACSRINVPTQITCGSIDSICPSEEAVKYYNEIGVAKEFLVVNGAFHDLGIMNLEEVGPSWLWQHLMDQVGYNPEAYRDITAKYMITWFDYFLYGRLGLYDQLFGTGAQEDLENGALTELMHENVS